MLLVRKETGRSEELVEGLEYACSLSRKCKSAGVLRQGLSFLGRWERMAERGGGGWLDLKVII